MGQVRIPNSAPRGKTGVYAKLLRRVREVARSGFDWEGVFVKPGALVEESRLRPDDSFPLAPLVLECAGIVRPGRGHNRSEYLYILWQWDQPSGRWLELGRSRCVDWSWAFDLAPIAHRAINREGFERQLAEIASRIDRYLTSELDGVAEERRWLVAAMVHEALARRIAESAAPVVDFSGVPYGL